MLSQKFSSRGIGNEKRASILVLPAARRRFQLRVAQMPEVLRQGKGQPAGLSNSSLAVRRYSEDGGTSLAEDGNPRTGRLK